MNFIPDKEVDLLTGDLLSTRFYSTLLADTVRLHTLKGINVALVGEWGCGKSLSLRRCRVTCQSLIKSTQLLFTTPGSILMIPSGECF